MVEFDKEDYLWHKNQWLKSMMTSTSMSSGNSKVTLHTVQPTSGHVSINYNEPEDSLLKELSEYRPVVSSGVFLGPTITELYPEIFWDKEAFPEVVEQMKPTPAIQPEQMARFMEYDPPEDYVYVGIAALHVPKNTPCGVAGMRATAETRIEAGDFLYYSSDTKLLRAYDVNGKSRLENPPESENILDFW